MKIYCLSGLGASFIAFRNLRIDAELIPVEWMMPEKNESLTSYCQRLIKKQIDTSEPIHLMGVSFGGIVVQEIAKTIEVDKTILISTICQRKEMPLSYRVFGDLGLPKLIPANFLNRTNPLLRWSFDLQKKDAKVFNKIISHTNTQFAKWAIERFVRWQPMENHFSGLRIHGSKDKVLPLPSDSKEINVIKDGGHLMILNRAKEISTIINAYLVE